MRRVRAQSDFGIMSSGAIGRRVQWEKHIPLTCPTLPYCPMPVLSGLFRQSTPQPERKAGCQDVLFYLSPQSPWAAGKTGWKSQTDCFREGPADALSLWAVKCLCFHRALESLTASHLSPSSAGAQQPVQPHAST